MKTANHNEQFQKNQTMVAHLIHQDINKGVYSSDIAKIIAQSPRGISVEYDEHNQEFRIQHFSKEILSKVGEEIRNVAVSITSDKSEIDSITFQAAYKYVAFSGPMYLYDRKVSEIIETICFK